MPRLKPILNNLYRAKDNNLNIYVKFVVTNVSDTDIVIKIVEPKDMGQKYGSIVYGMSDFKRRYRLSINYTAKASN